MNLAQLLGLDASKPLPRADLATIEVSGLSLDSRSVQAGDVFLACVGSQDSHGIAYAGEAGKKGAVAILWEPTAELGQMPSAFKVQDDDGEREIPLLAIGDLHQKVGLLAANFFGDASRELLTLGVTGTNGKTSVSLFLAQALSSAQLGEQQKCCAVLGTIGNGLFDESYSQIQASTHTTLDAVSLQGKMAELKELGAEAVAMEVSSHALDQHRVAATNFDVAIFTNLSRDHLDYHGDMQAYAEAKFKLFTMPGLKTAVINADDDYGQQFIQRLQAEASNDLQVLSYSANGDKDASLWAEDIEYSSRGISFELCSTNERQAVQLGLLGQFNIANVLSVATALMSLTYSLAQITALLGELKSVIGRMQLMIGPEAADNSPLGQVVVDYAHTPDALEQALKAIKAHTKSQQSNAKVICVFGCGGNRDVGKRKLMGEVAANYADMIVLTNDNPRFEEPEAIIADIESGLGADSNYSKQVDRAKAIELAMQMAAKDDIILIAGKGHEPYQEVAGQRHYFSDQDVVIECLAKLSSKSNLASSKKP